MEKRIRAVGWFRGNAALCYEHPCSANSIGIILVVRARSAGAARLLPHPAAMDHGLLFPSVLVVHTLAAPCCRPAWFYLHPFIVRKHPLQVDGPTALLGQCFAVCSLSKQN